MSTPHKHAEFIKAIADGVSVDMRAVGDDTRSWTTLLYFYPFDNEGIEFRLTPHCWQAEIDAHKAGKALQWRLPIFSTWKDAIGTLNFDVPSAEFRIKPETIRYRVALLKIDGRAYTVTADNESQAARTADRSSFQGWVGDWQEVEA